MGVRYIYSSFAHLLICSFACSLVSLFSSAHLITWAIVYFWLCRSTSSLTSTRATSYPPSAKTCRYVSVYVELLLGSFTYIRKGFRGSQTPFPSLIHTSGGRRVLLLLQGLQVVDALRWCYWRHQLRCLCMHGVPPAVPFAHGWRVPVRQECKVVLGCKRVYVVAYGADDRHKKTHIVSASSIYLHF